MADEPSEITEPVPGSFVESEFGPRTFDVGLVLVWVGLIVVAVAVALGTWSMIDLADTYAGGGPTVPKLRATQYFTYLMGTPMPVALLGLLVAAAGLLVRRLDFTDWSKG